MWLRLVAHDPDSQSMLLVVNVFERKLILWRKHESRLFKFRIDVANGEFITQLGLVAEHVRSSNDHHFAHLLEDDTVEDGVEVKSKLV